MLPERPELFDQSFSFPRCLRFTFHVLRFTIHVSRFTRPKHPLNQRPHRLLLLPPLLPRNQFRLRAALRAEVVLGDGAAPKAEVMNARVAEHFLAARTTTRGADLRVVHATHRAVVQGHGLILLW